MHITGLRYSRQQSAIAQQAPEHAVRQWIGERNSEQLRPLKPPQPEWAGTDYGKPGKQGRQDQAVKPDSVTGEQAGDDSVAMRATPIQPAQQRRRELRGSGKSQQA